MKGTRVAKRYAKAFIDLTVEKGVLEKAYADMLMIVNFSKGSHDFMVFLKSPLIRTEKKLTVIKTIFDGNVDAITASYIQLVTAKKREEYLVEIAKEFVSQYKERKNIVTAVITSATRLDKAILEAVSKIVKTEGVSAVEIEEVINEKLIGGLIVRVGDRQVDASIARKLSDLRQNFNN